MAVQAYKMFYLGEWGGVIIYPARFVKLDLA